ncbi:AAA family ATPase [Erythrobacter sp. HKB08]|uniref:AAA family ATPase n=1 Tax=Erythrobacter sp. HKB08 TaxID=2502843 RepID=UPI0010089935|nr:AAA family ATPase [Erythrobacter sp. HKB08]
MAEIFISYNREDQAAAGLFARAFEAAGHSVWWDVALRAGQVYDEVTEQALRTARAVVVLWSPRSVNSRWVRAEATLAQRFGTFVPCTIEPCDRPIMFELTQTPDLSHWQGDASDPAWAAFLHHVREFLNVGKAAQPASAPAQPGMLSGELQQAGITSTPAPPQPIPQPAPQPQPNLQQAAATPAQAPARNGQSERRQITFLAAEPVGGTQLASQFDPEDWHEFVTSLQARITPVIENMGGTANWSGPELSALFGYPHAQEHAAERAIRAGIEVARLGEQIACENNLGCEGELSLHCGIHTASVLVAASAGGDAEMFGDGATVASSTCSAAPPSGVLVTDSVRELAGGAFDLADGPANGSTRLFQVEGAKKRVQLARSWASGALHGFVGREEELAMLKSRWKKTEAGEGQHVLVRGEPGIGKTRLVEEFHRWIGEREHSWVTLQGASLYPNTPYHALGTLVRNLAEGHEGHAGEWLEMRSEQLGLPSKLLPLLAPSIGLRLPDHVLPTTIANEQQRPQLLATIIEAAFILAKRKPVLLLVDDLQWIDPSTLEVVHMLVEQAQTERIMVLCTARPEFEAPWSDDEHHARITLGKLGTDEMAQLVAEAAGAAADLETIQKVLDRANGVPLFAEELSRLLASGNGEIGEHAMPPTLRELFAARMDRIGDARELLQVAAVIGREFKPSILASIGDADSASLDAHLARLCDEQLLFRRGAPPLASYRFKHALVQDAAYETLPKKRQKALHLKAAEVLSSEGNGEADIAQEVLAMHWMRGDAFDKAAAAWESAGQAAYSRGACKEAVSHFRQGLAALERMPESDDRNASELRLWSALNRALQQTLGYANPVTVEAANKALALAKQSGTLRKAVIEEAQLWRAVLTSGDYAEADRIAERVIALGREMDEGHIPPWIDYFATNARLQTDFYAGRINHIERDYAEFCRTMDNEEAHRHVMDDVVGIGIGALGAWMIGRSDLAQERMAQAVQMGKESGQPFPAAVSLHFAGTLSALDLDLDATHDYSAKALKISKENGLAYIGHLVQAKLDWVGGRDDSAQANVESMRRSIDAMVTADSRVGMIFYMNRLAMALDGKGKAEEAMATIEDALNANPQERVIRPQSLIVRGRFHEEAGRHDEAEADFAHALSLAEEMGALALEFYATHALASFLADQDRPEEARKAIESVLAKCEPETNSPYLDMVRELKAELGG